MSFTQRILLSMLAGVVVGVALNASAAALPSLNTFLVDGLFYVVGAIFLALLKLMVVPLVLVSLVCGVNAMGDLRTIGRVGAKTVALFLATTAAAVTLGLSLGLVVSPGEGFELEGAFAEVAPREMPRLTEVFINIFPENPVQAMAEGQMLQIIVFALLFGFAANLAGERAKPVVKLFNDLNEVIPEDGAAHRRAGADRPVCVAGPDVCDARVGNLHSPGGLFPAPRRHVAVSSAGRLLRALAGLWAQSPQVPRGACVPR